MRRILLVLTGALSLAARDGAAQDTKAGALEFGLFGRATFDYGEAFDASTGFGIGGRAGVALGKRFALDKAERLQDDCALRVGRTFEDLDAAETSGERLGEETRVRPEILLVQPAAELTDFG